MPQSQGAESPSDGEGSRPRAIRPPGREGQDDLPHPPESPTGSGLDFDAAAKVIDALKATADQEFSIAERLSGKARQAFALAAGFFIVGQTVAFGSFEAAKLSTHEKRWVIALAIVAVALLAVAVGAALKADATYKSRDLPLGKLEDDLNAAYEGDPNVMGNLGSYYLGIVRTRREGNRARRRWYQATRVAVTLSLGATVAELVYSLIGRTS